MSTINLKRLITEREISSLISDCVALSDSPITLWDAQSNLLLGKEQKDATQRYPVELNGEKLGWVAGDEKASLLASLISFAAVREYEKRALTKETLAKYRELVHLFDLAEQIASSLASEEVARVAIDQAIKSIRATGASIMLHAEKEDSLSVVAAHGDEYQPKTIMKGEAGIAGTVMQSGKAEIVNDVSSDPRFIKGVNEVHSLMCAPLKSKGKTIGVINISSKEQYNYRAEDLQLLMSIASQTAIALINAQLFEQLRAYSEELENKNIQLQKEIAQRKQSEKALRASEEKYRLHFENVLDVIYSVDADFKIITISPSVEKILGYAPEELIGRAFPDLNLLTEDSLKRSLADTMRIMDGERIDSAEYEFIAKDGSIKAGEVSRAPLFENGKIVAIFSVARDITERTQAQQELFKSEERFRTMAENIMDGLVIVENGKVVFVNGKASEITGYSAEELMLFGSGVDFVVPEQQAEMKPIHSQALAEGSYPHPIEVWITRKDGTRRCVSKRLSLFKRGDGMQTGYEIITDITEKEQAEERLRATTTFLDNIIESSQDCIIATDGDGYLTRVNKYFLEILGYREDEVLGKHPIEFSPRKGETYESTTGEIITIDHELYENVLTDMERLVEEGKLSNWEFYLLRKDKKIIPLEVNIVYLHDDDMNKIGAVGILRDITERKKAERQLKGTRDFLDSIIESSLDCVVVSDRKGYLTRVNNYFLELTGYRKEEVLGKHISELAPPAVGNYKLLSGEIVEIEKSFFDDQLSMIATLREKGEVSNWEAYYYRKDRKLIPVEQNIMYLYNEDGKRSGSVGISRDIGARKKAEQEIAETRDFLQDVITTSLDGIVVTDAQGAITMLNKSAVNILGYSQEELLGNRIQKYLEFGGELEMQGKQIQKNLMEKGAVYGYEHKWMRKDRSYIDVEMSIALLQDHNNNLAGSVLSIRDISERKQAEKKILDYQDQLRSLASQLTLTEEQERRRIATDLHDRIGQTLAISKIKLGALRASTTSLGLDKDVDEIRDLVEQSIQDTRSLIFDLCPPFLYEVGFEKALEWLLEDIQEQYGIETQFECDGEPYQLDDDLRILLYQSVRELFINIVKHAQAQHVRLSVQQDPTGFNLCVEDDGRGFDQPTSAFRFDKEGGFGLFRIQERLHYLGGTITIDSKPHQGTKISLVLPFTSSEHTYKEDVK